jgi:hypothetical protein
MTREEVLTVAKKRALLYLDAGDLPGAVASMVSDLNLHADLAISAELMGMLGIYEVKRGPEAVRHWIEGFN